MSLASSFCQNSDMGGCMCVLHVFYFTIDTRDCTADIQQFVDEYNVNCDLRFNGGVSLATTVEEAVDLRRQYELLHSTGCDVNAQWWDATMCAERTKGKSYLCGVFKPGNANLYPAKLVAAIVKEAVNNGAHLRTYTNVLSVQQQQQVSGRSGDSSRLLVRTNHGNIYCEHAVHCTNAWARELIPALHGIITPVRNQVMVTAPLPVVLWNHGLSANRGYVYLMQMPDKRLVIGGLRNLNLPTMDIDSTDESTPVALVSSALSTYFADNFDASGFPGLTADQIKVEQEWIGILGFSKDCNPLIGPMQTRPGEYLAAGFTGHGMPYCFLAGKHIAEMIAGNSEPVGFLPHVFLPARFGI
jgi:glycine/D-amino acid oxidase-like deaminating enzyme